MKAQVLTRYDDALKSDSWVAMQDVPDPKIKKSTDVIVRIGTQPASNSKLPSGRCSTIWPRARG